MPSGSYETITMSLRRLQGKMSQDIVLFLLSHDFGSVFGRGREDDVGRVHGLLPIHNLDLGSGIPACLGWYLLMLGVEH